MPAPTNAKQPQDHRPAQTETEGGQVVEVRGLRLIIDSDALDDFELLESIALIDQGSQQGGVRAPQVLRAFLGNEQYAEAMDVLRDDHGRVRIADGAEFLGELIRALDPNGGR